MTSLENGDHVPDKVELAPPLQLESFAPAFVTVACENYLSSGAGDNPKTAMAHKRFEEWVNNSQLSMSQTGVVNLSVGLRSRRRPV